jgi:hypothetical protein
MCAIALTSVKAQEVRASIGRTRKTAKKEDSVAKSSKACKKSKVIANFLVQPKMTDDMESDFVDPDDSQILEGVDTKILQIAGIATELEPERARNRNLESQEATLIEDFGSVYPSTVEEKNCGEPGFCGVSTETTICVLDSADADVVDKFEKKLGNTFLKKLFNFFSKRRFDFEVGYSPYPFFLQSVELVEY